MKFQCDCGHIIRDQTDYLPYKATFIPDEDEEAVFGAVTRSLEAFIIARESGKQDDFLRVRFGEGYLQALTTHDILSDLLIELTRSARFIYECEICGRVFIQKQSEYGKNVYGTYIPEDNIRGVLQSQHTHSDKDISQ
ncbi:hypothetical protein [Dictyobacter aurantiacus]|uniref:Uncharacterized protein n=1 Tax=Dictyobacter aurantiacus TaxID=1936993 RepID=A0A401ZRF6_9CHLR|nr:hypothetical protein [Dictyobacter aurantiacus]GCE09498.1 hypothetical protein KDAU_68270 [Dictyobacter aurantiacus]